MTFTVMLIEKVKQTRSIQFDIIKASNGQEALDRYNEMFGQIKVIIMDSQMPVMDGYDASQQIRDFEE